MNEKCNEKFGDSRTKRTISGRVFPRSIPFLIAYLPPSRETKTSFFGTRAHFFLRVASKAAKSKLGATARSRLFRADRKGFLAVAQRS